MIMGSRAELYFEKFLAYFPKPFDMFFISS
jgi:hypothetical protein